MYMIPQHFFSTRLFFTGFSPQVEGSADSSRPSDPSARSQCKQTPMSIGVKKCICDCHRLKFHSVIKSETNQFTSPHRKLKESWTVDLEEPCKRSWYNKGVRGEVHECVVGYCMVPQRWKHINICHHCWKLFKIETPLTWLNLIRIFPH